MKDFCQACGYARDLHTPASHEFVPDLTEVDQSVSEPVDSRTLEQELSIVLNKHSAENGSNTPDFILAEYLTACLKAYNVATKAAREWQGVGYLNVGTTDT